MTEFEKLPESVKEWLVHDNTRKLAKMLEEQRGKLLKQLIQTGEASQDVNVRVVVEQIRGAERALSMLYGGEAFLGPGAPRRDLPASQS